MKELFKKLRIAAYLSAVLTIALGGVLIAWPMEVTGLICRILGALLVVMGAVYIFGYVMEGRGILTITGGLLFLLLGVWIFITPESIATLVPIVIGVVLLVHSLRDFQMASEGEEKRQRSVDDVVFTGAFELCVWRGLYLRFLRRSFCGGTDAWNCACLRRDIEYVHRIPYGARDPVCGGKACADRCGGA